MPSGRGYKPRRLLRSWGLRPSRGVRKRSRTALVSLDGLRRQVPVRRDVATEPSEMGRPWLVRPPAGRNAPRRETSTSARLFRAREWLVLPREIPTAHTGWLGFPLTVRLSVFTRRDLQIHFERNKIQMRRSSPATCSDSRLPRDRRRTDSDGYPEPTRSLRHHLACHHGSRRVARAHPRHVPGFIERYVRAVSRTAWPARRRRVEAVRAPSTRCFPCRRIAMTQDRAQVPAIEDHHHTGEPAC
jgi:hypothetical protein